MGYLCAPPLALVSREWAEAYRHARPGWQAYLCVWGYSSHRGGFAPRCSGCLPVTLDYLRLTLFVDSDIARPWVTRVQTRPHAKRRPVWERTRQGVTPGAVSAVQRHKRRRLPSYIRQDAEPS